MIIDYDKIISDLEARKVQIDECIGALQRLQKLDGGTLESAPKLERYDGPSLRPVRVVGGVSVRLNQNPRRLNQNNPRKTRLKIARSPERSCATNAARGHSKPGRPAARTFAITTALDSRSPRRNRILRNQTAVPTSALSVTNATRSFPMRGLWGFIKPACTSGSTRRRDRR